MLGTASSRAGSMAELSEVLGQGNRSAHGFQKDKDQLISTPLPCTQRAAVRHGHITMIYRNLAGALPQPGWVPGGARALQRQQQHHSSLSPLQTPHSSSRGSFEAGTPCSGPHPVRLLGGAVPFTALITARGACQLLRSLVIQTSTRRARGVFPAPR